MRDDYLLPGELHEMTASIAFPHFDLPPHTDSLREEVRHFLKEQINAGVYDPEERSHTAKFNRDFSRKVGEKGWIGITWPKEFGGQARSYFERYVITEEFLAAGAPVRAHFVADRQSGPVLIKYGARRLQEELLPQIVRGELSFCIGMSEPDSGSDLFAAKAPAVRVEDGWKLSGRKLWTSLAHKADYMIGVFRTAPSTKENRRTGLSQFLIDLKTPGISIRPVLFPNGEHDFNEVTFDEVIIPEDHLLGVEGNAWQQLTSELAYERSGPERFLETLGVLKELIRLAGPDPDLRLKEGLGRLTAQLYTLRRMSISVAGALEEGREPVLEASLVKEVGTVWEQALPGVVRDLGALLEANNESREDFDQVMQQMTLIAPKLTIQGGTIEILRGIIARGLGLR